MVKCKAYRPCCICGEEIKDKRYKFTCTNPSCKEKFRQQSPVTSRYQDYIKKYAKSYYKKPEVVVKRREYYKNYKRKSE